MINTIGGRVTLYGSYFGLYTLEYQCQGDYTFFTEHYSVCNIFHEYRNSFFICGDEVTHPISLPIAQSHRMGDFRIHALRYRCSIVGTPAVPFGVLSIATLTA